MADFTIPFAQDADIRLATPTEKLTGFPCGPADKTLFDGLFNQLQRELLSIHDAAGIAKSDASYNTTLLAILALIDAATGGGDPSAYVLMSQARARLPIFPEFQTSDFKINVASPATGTVRIPSGVTFLHRGIYLVETTQEDFATSASKTYHVRWNPVDGYSLNDLADAGYNPSGYAEINTSFDSTYDDMLIARVVTNSSNIATITNLANAAVLTRQQTLAGTNGRSLNLNPSFFDIDDTYNWARTPSNYVLSPAKVVNNTDRVDSDFMIMPTYVGAPPQLDLGTAPQYSVNRYKMGQTIACDYTEALWMNWSARA